MRLAHRLELVAELGLQRLAHRLEIVAGIEALGNCADVLAERLAVAQERRARQHVDLRAGVVDVVLARHREAGDRQQIGERIAEHRAAAMADMHRPGRIGRDVFDVHRLARADAAPAVVRAGADRVGQRLAPHRRIERQVDEARPRDLGLGDLGKLCELGRDLLGKLARLQARVLGERHRRIGREIAVARLARRLDHDARQIERGRHGAGLGQRLDGGADVLGEDLEDVHCVKELMAGG